MSYVILEDESALDLAKQINTYKSSGFELVGGIAVVWIPSIRDYQEDRGQLWYFQAMERKDEVKTKVGVRSLRAKKRRDD